MLSSKAEIWRTFCHRRTLLWRDHFIVARGFKRRIYWGMQERAEPPLRNGIWGILNLSVNCWIEG